MNWTEVNIYTKSEGVDILCASLMDIGIKGFEVKDSNDFKEFLANKDGKWDYIDDDLMNLSNCETCLTVYLPDNSQGAEMLVSLRSVLKNMKSNDSNDIFGRLEIEMENVREEDWANNWKQYFKPLKIGRKILVKPSWEEYSGDDDRVVIEIDPASSFGTGQHNTTKLCLELMEDSLKPGDRVLDLGCGSGILSIGAMLLGADHATAVDIEENAVETALENAGKNHIPEDKYSVYCGDVITDTALDEKIGDQYDLITANIVADVLIAMSNIFRRKIKNGGTLIISGIITERKDEVVNAVVKSGFEVVKSAEGEGWAAVELKAI
ncbi:50S ribosomal protein L11 methyltransferase [Porcipelethomonas sp.]|uniref:50S ribosomal protein L11 methyltransferase n=1 Tax=Porcipelethomonas sp. TaxID=2981675 RepID=UPI003EF14E95